MKCFICGEPTEKPTSLFHAKCKWSKEDREWEKKVGERKEKVRLTIELIHSVCNGRVAKMRLGLLKDEVLTS